MCSIEVIYIGDVSFMIANITFTSIPDSPKKRWLDSGSLHDQECPNLELLEWELSPSETSRNTDLAEAEVRIILKSKTLLVDPVRD